MRLPTETGNAVKRLNPALFKAHAALGLTDSVAVARGPLPAAELELEPEPEPPRERTNAWSDGRRWQETIRASAALYERDGVLALEKTDPSVRIVGGKEDRKVIFKKSRLVDFVGCHKLRGGRAIFIESKQTQEDRLPLGRPGGLTAAQVATLRDWALAGAMAALVWKSASGVWLVPYRDVLRAALAQRKSLLPSDGKVVECAGVVRLPDGSAEQRPLFGEALAECYPKEAA